MSRESPLDDDASTAELRGALSADLCRFDEHSLTAAQWRYLLTRQEFLKRRQRPPQKAICMEAKIDETTVSRWKCDWRWERAVSRVMAAQHAINGRAVIGSSTTETPTGTSQRRLRGASGSVTFINLPRPPTPAERDARNPPPGSPDGLILKVQS